MTLGGVLKHMAINEDYIFTQKLTGDPVGEPWESRWDGTDDWEFTSAAADPPETLYALWEDAVARSRTRLDAALARGGLDQLVHGHADLIREAVDGRVGEDPPPGWQPRSGR